MGESAGPPARSRGGHREAIYIFIATVIVLVVIIAAFNLMPTSEGRNGFEIANGQYIDYVVSGKVGNMGVGGEVRYLFTVEDAGSPSFIVTLSELPPMDTAPPFSFDPLLTSKYFDYDGTNITCIGELLIVRLPQYTGSNGSGMGPGTFGALVDHRVVQTSLGAGEAAHYVYTGDGVTLEQWVLVGTGLPIRLEYADAGGTELTFSGWESNIGWIMDLSS